MKIENILLLSILLLVSIFILTGCRNQKEKNTVNEITMSLKDVKKLTISYDDENLDFFESPNNNLIIKEYISQNNKKYFANIQKDKESIKISEGGKPVFKDGFTRRVEVYLPITYSKNLNITITNGNIDISNINLSLDSIYIDCTSGNVDINEIVATNIYLSSTSGEFEIENIVGGNIIIDTTQANINCKKIEGNVSYTTTNGNAQFMCAIGGGNYKVNNSGKLYISYDEVTGDIDCYNKNDNIEILLPASLNFEFEAIAKNGCINTNFQNYLSINENLTTAKIGDNANVVIKAETKNGNIDVKR